MDENKGKRVTVVVRKRGGSKASVVPKMVATMRNQSRNEILSDVNGSYTGNPVDDDVPVQDADDL